MARGIQSHIKFVKNQPMMCTNVTYCEKKEILSLHIIVFEVLSDYVMFRFTSSQTDMAQWSSLQNRSGKDEVQLRTTCHRN